MIEPKDRPTFVDILLQLEEIGNSEFIATSHASFRSLQQTWRVEIESRFAELRVADEVRAAANSHLDAAIREFCETYFTFFCVLCGHKRN